MDRTRSDSRAPSTDRVDLARRIIDYEPAPERLPPGVGPRVVRAAARPTFPWPDGTAPTPRPPPKKPRATAALPQADYLAITWTAAEAEALADVLTPGTDRQAWFPYKRRFSRYVPAIRDGAPALDFGRLGTWFPTSIAGRSVICFKSDLHLNQDGIATGAGTATLPVADLFRQLVDEVKPRLIVTEGTAGATFPDHVLGDVMVTRAARFRLRREFRNETFNDTTFKSAGAIPDRHLDTADAMLATLRPRFREPDFGPPSRRYPFHGPLLHVEPQAPRLRVEGRDLPAGTPVLSTDFFEFGTSKNGLENEGCAVEMGDAVLGMVTAQMGAAAPRWLVVRNASDPQINGELPDAPHAFDMQAHWAVWYYETYGYWTSVCSAIATWAVIAGDV